MKLQLEKWKYRNFDSHAVLIGSTTSKSREKWKQTKKSDKMAQAQQKIGGHGWPKSKTEPQASMKVPVSQSLTLNRTINL